MTEVENVLGKLMTSLQKGKDLLEASWREAVMQY